MLLDKKHIHFVGIGGIGMSGIAVVLSEMGYRVSGSDVESNNLTARIERMGGKIYKDHKAANIAKETGLVIYSSSIPKTNPELLEAARRGLPIIHRAEMLGELVNGKIGIAVTGTHGKTTTTSLISVMLENSKRDPSVIIGGEVDLFNGNAKYGKGEYFVAEADESDGSFLHLKPFYSVITNIEMEHMDYYKTMADVLSAYSSFAGNTKDGGVIFYNYDDKNARALLKGLKKDTQSYGFSGRSDIYPVDIHMETFDTSYKCVYQGRALGEVRLKIPGMHNVLNSLAAILVGMRSGLGFHDIVDSIRDFNGAKRRFCLRSDAGGVMLIEDYAHHPTEIRAVLDACRNWRGKRVIAIFQPHRYTRTLHLSDEFGKCFKGADELILTDIYPASEEPIKGVSVKNIYDSVKANGKEGVTILDKNSIAEYVMKIKKDNDMILVLGAGDIKKVADQLAERLKGDACSNVSIKTS